ncbi:MAG: hypothetical protein A2648_01300 [Candidatus Lloydbacteria bacterium RIFCSPHIGHO2_01_FULL_41_20]|uniref:ASCH domain-containing protein n=1 Tax=Candidatus Lloydbacteria bacterium RIFCSPHIGHO2_01_FULL_41_20 TaxID=1798657 RepID=A0A1G2CTY4_9BACT|nr:MAG: hypothetical protein A2648_01300 [Candidatus Lloydbacteria bacterium RIFCSPHIGHO2_01_FULL_41_20]
MKRVLRFRAVDKNIFDAIKSGKKKIETRAATVKYKDIKTGDVFVFVCGKSRFERKVKKVFHSKTVEGLLKKYKIKDIRPDIKTKEKFVKSYEAFAGYSQKIRRFGIMAFEV